MLSSIGTSRAELADARDVTIPLPLFRFLMQIAVAHADFNEEGYLAANPDVAEAVKAGTVDSARLHYVGFGFFEGRRGATPEVDERWYLKTYPDVGSAVRAGQIGSAAEHFTVVGASEGRSPSIRYAQDAEQWKKALRAA
ncbi:hypothetical protein [Falsiroseomonas sp. HW251]|uniref:hypothetical protein n=1 Tax=Falsiroseomonas sp. HW251 TaxID=3390998 RepID=UPI003D3150F1